MKTYASLHCKPTSGRVMCFSSQACCERKDQVKSVPACIPCCFSVTSDWPHHRLQATSASTVHWPSQESWSAQQLISPVSTSAAGTACSTCWFLWRACLSPVLCWSAERYKDHRISIVNVALEVEYIAYGFINLCTGADLSEESSFFCCLLWALSVSLSIMRSSILCFRSKILSSFNLLELLCSASISNT